MAAQVGVGVSFVEPAVVLDTVVAPKAVAAGLDPQGMLAQAGPYAPAFAAYWNWVRGQAVNGAQTAPEIAAIVVDALTAEHPDFRIQGNEWEGNTCQRSWPTPPAPKSRP